MSLSIRNIGVEKEGPLHILMIRHGIAHAKDRQLPSFEQDRMKEECSACAWLNESPVTKVKMTIVRVIISK